MKLAGRETPQSSRPIAGSLFCSARRVLGRNQLPMPPTNTQGEITEVCRNRLTICIDGSACHEGGRQAHMPPAHRHLLQRRRRTRRANGLSIKIGRCIGQPHGHSRHERHRCRKQPIARCSLLHQYGIHAARLGHSGFRTGGFCVGRPCQFRQFRRHEFIASPKYLKPPV